MGGLAEAVQGAVGQPASVRIGTVDSIDPTVISAQGTPFEDVGFLDGYVPEVGDTVALLGQSSGSGSDPASWLTLGKVQAESAPIRFQAGEELFTFVGVASAFIDVTFAIPFESPPSVAGNIATTAGVANQWFVRCATVTTTGFRLLVSSAAINTWTNVPVQWQAQLMTQ
jgi:hypothetical protein